jgi:glycosyltransferase involved in cell wall biosynthesis
MTQHFAGEAAAHGQVLAVLDVTTSNTRHATSDPVLDHVVAELEDRRRAVHVWRAEVPDRAPGSWLPTLAESIRANLLRAGSAAPSSVHAFGWRAALGLAAASSPGGPALVAHLGDGPDGAGRDDQAGSKLERLLWASARTVDAVVLDSEWAIDRAAACGVPRARLVRGLPVVTSPEADVPWSIRDGARSPRLVAVGGVGPTAGTDTLLDAVARICDVELVVAAPSDAAESRLVKARRWLRRRGNGAGDRVRLERFSRSLLEDCDVVVDAGTGAGCADGVVRAMSHRRAVIASDVGPRAEAVVAGTTGELVAPGDPRRWRDRIIQLLQDPFRLEAYGDAGYERSRVGFAPARRAELMLHLDERLTEARSAPVKVLTSANRALDAA